jgi:hypothetical protein
VKPTPEHPVSSWRWYVLSGATVDEIRQRLDEVPEEIREEVRVTARKQWTENSSARLGKQPSGDTNHDQES